MAIQWFYQVEGKQLEPIEPPELRRLADRGIVKPDAPVRKGVDGPWMPAKKVRGLWRQSDSPPSPAKTPPAASAAGREFKSVPPPPAPIKAPPLPPAVPAAPLAALPEKPDRIHPVTWAAIIAGAGVVLLLLWAMVFRGGSAPPQQAEMDETVVEYDGSGKVGGLSVQEKWPAAFSPESFKRIGDSSVSPDSFLPTQTEDEARRLGAAYGYDMFLKKCIAVLGQEFPEAKPRLLAGQVGYERRFGPAIKNIQRIAQSNIPDWETLEAEIRKRWEQQISTRNVNSENLDILLKEIEDVGEGKVRSPVLETLLIYHPKYQGNPALEFLDGYTKEYLTDGTGKSKGIKLRIEYPASWKAEPGLRPHIVQKFSSQCGRGREALTLLIADLPIGPGKPSEDEWSEITPQTMSEISVSGNPGAKNIDSGQFRLAGSPVGWTEYECQVNRVGVKLTMHGLHLVLFHRGRYVIIGLAAYSAPDVEAALAPGVTTATAKERFLRSSMLFQQMLNSFDFMDRYED